MSDGFPPEQCRVGHRRECCVDTYLQLRTRSEVELDRLRKSERAWYGRSGSYWTLDRETCRVGPRLIVQTFPAKNALDLGSRTAPGRPHCEAGLTGYG